MKGRVAARAEVRVFESPLAAASAAADVLAARVGAGGHVALAGGSTPAEAYRIAATKQADWRGAILWFGDERCVPPDHEWSNYRMVERTLLAKIAKGKEPEVMRVLGEDRPESAAGDYEARLREQLGNAPQLDLVLLGLGPDAHTASLFPGKPALEEDRRLVAAVPEAGMEPQVPRVTMTFPLLNAAAEVVFLVAGSEKAPAVARAFGAGSDPAAPAARVRPASGRLIVICDEGAARGL